MNKLDIREKAEVLKLLGHPTRLLVLEELAKGTKCVTDIRDLLEIEQSNLSQHLSLLRRRTEHCSSEGTCGIQRINQY